MHIFQMFHFMDIVSFVRKLWKPFKIEIMSTMLTITLLDSPNSYGFYSNYASSIHVSSYKQHNKKFPWITPNPIFPSQYLQFPKYWACLWRLSCVMPLRISSFRCKSPGWVSESKQEIRLVECQQIKNTLKATRTFKVSAKLSLRFCIVN